MGKGTCDNSAFRACLLWFFYTNKPKSIVSANVLVVLLLLINLPSFLALNILINVFELSLYYRFWMRSYASKAWVGQMTMMMIGFEYCYIIIFLTQCWHNWGICWVRPERRRFSCARNFSVCSVNCATINPAFGSIIGDPFSDEIIRYVLVWQLILLYGKLRIIFWL